MIDRFTDGLLTPSETSSYLQIPQGGPAAYAVRAEGLERTWP